MYHLTQLPADPHGPYYVGRLRDGSTQCDCADWIYKVAETPGAPPCKHIAALEGLGWL
jgi:predicted nucleic acid-binding Zn finger protein